MRTIANIFQAVNDRLTLKADRGPIGIGLIGVGGWGAYNATNIMRCRRFNIIGVYDIQADDAVRLANRFNVKSYSDLDVLLGESRIQAVAVTVPNHCHADAVRAAADAGKHVFVEKPLASNADLCRELGTYCREREVILQVGHQMRREPVFREIKHVLRSGELGRLLFIRGVYTLDRRSRKDWRRDPRACPGESMEQLGVHLIDVVISLLGPPQRSYGWRRNTSLSRDGLDWACVSMSFTEGVCATILTSFSSPRHILLELFCEKGHLGTDGSTLWLRRNPSSVKRIRPKGIPGSVSQFLEFANCIEQGTPPETGAMEAAVVMNAANSIIDRSEE